jgi:hypothetical protein
MLCSNLSQGLHAAAQPLAILRASLDSSHSDRMSVEELRELAATSAVEVERVCALFSGLQQLISIESIKPHISVTPLLPLLAQVAEGVDLLFRQDGMFLSTQFPGTCQPVLIDSGRAQQALSSVLLVAHAVSRAPDTVELIASSSLGTARVMVRNPSSQVGAVDAETRLGMAIAEANLRSQQAAFTWSLRPFNVQIEFQTASLAHP